MPLARPTFALLGAVVGFGCWRAFGLFARRLGCLAAQAAHGLRHRAAAQFDPVLLQVRGDLVSGGLGAELLQGGRDRAIKRLGHGLMDKVNSGCVRGQ